MVDRMYLLANSNLIEEIESFTRVYNRVIKEYKLNLFYQKKKKKSYKYNF